MNTNKKKYQSYINYRLQLKLFINKCCAFTKVWTNMYGAFTDFAMLAHNLVLFIRSKIRSELTKQNRVGATVTNAIRLDVHFYPCDLLFGKLRSELSFICSALNIFEHS